MNRVFAVFIVFCTLLFQGNGDTSYKHDGMSIQDKKRMKDIAEELVKEAQLKMRQIASIRDTHSQSMAFDFGLIMGNIREKYRRMLETYREYRDKFSGRSKFYPSAIMKMTPIFYIMAMEDVHALEVDIDKMVHIFEAIDSEVLNPDPRYDNSPTTKRKKGLRSFEVKMIARMAEEQELKSRAREAHLMSRLGLSERLHTTAKRFQHQWPVVKNWDLGAYGDMGQYS